METFKASDGIRKEILHGVEICYSSFYSPDDQFRPVSPYFGFSESEPIQHLSASVCTMLVTRLGNTWGICHAYVFTDDHKKKGIPQGDLPMHNSLLEFLHLSRQIRTGHSDRAFLFGANFDSGRKKALQSRKEAIKLLIEQGGFEENEITCRWNNSYDTAVSVAVYPELNRIVVSGDQSSRLSTLLSLFFEFMRV